MAGQKRPVKPDLIMARAAWADQMSNAIQSDDAAPVSSNERAEPPEAPVHDYSSPSSIFIEPSSVNVFAERRKLINIRNGKILLVGLQKSGNTWLQSLLADSLDLPYLFSLDEASGPGVLSTHLPFCDEIKYRNDFVHSVCLVRDLRDIVLSYFEYMNSPGYKSEIPYARYEDIETFYYDWFLARLVPAHRFHTFTEEYAERGVPVVRYERLLKDTVGEVVRLFERWDEEVDRERVERAVETNQLEKLKATGKEMGAVRMHPSHFNKGQIGRYKQNLPASIIRDIEYRFGAVLTRWGYPTKDWSYLAVRPTVPPSQLSSAAAPGVTLADNTPLANAERILRAVGVDPRDLSQLLNFFGHASDLPSVLRGLGVDLSLAKMVAATAQQDNSVGSEQTAAGIRELLEQMGQYIGCPADQERINLLLRFVDMAQANSIRLNLLEQFGRTVRAFEDASLGTSSIAVDVFEQVAQYLGQPADQQRAKVLLDLMEADGMNSSGPNLLGHIARYLGEPPDPQRIHFLRGLMQTTARSGLREAIIRAIVQPTGKRSAKGNEPT